MKRIATFDQLLKQYFLEKPLSPATRGSYERILRTFIRDTGIEHLNEVTLQALLEWRMSVIERTSDITWNTYLRHMRALWNFAHDKGVVDQDNPFLELHWGKYKRSPKKKTLSSGQISSIIRLLSDPDCSLEPCWFWKLVVRFIYFTGVRRQQLVAIRWKDIDFDDQTLFLSGEHEKTDKSRHIPIQDSILHDLREYRLLMKLYYPSHFKPDQQLFNVTLFYDRYRGKEMSDEQLSGFFRRLSEKVGFHVSAHMLRHTMATEIAKTGQIKALQNILGHANIHTTMSFYVHPDIKQMRRTINRLSEI